MVLQELLDTLGTTPEIRVINAETGKTLFVGYDKAYIYKNCRVLTVAPRIFQNRYAIKPIIDISITPYEVGKEHRYGENPLEKNCI